MKIFLLLLLVGCGAAQHDDVKIGAGATVGLADGGVNSVGGNITLELDPVGGTCTVKDAGK